MYVVYKLNTDNEAKVWTYMRNLLYFTLPAAVDPYDMKMSNA
jgi:hypothetical protein